MAMGGGGGGPDSPVGRRVRLAEALPVSPDGLALVSRDIVSGDWDCADRRRPRHGGSVYVCAVDRTFYLGCLGTRRPSGLPATTLVHRAGSGRRRFPFDAL